MDSTTQQSDIANMIASVNATIAKLETAAATVGTAQEQVATQTTFVSTMQSNLSNGIASLTNADMNQVSTRLQALQTQQQLGVQSLSIANQSQPDDPEAVPVTDARVQTRPRWRQRGLFCFEQPNRPAGRRQALGMRQLLRSLGDSKENRDGRRQVER